MAWSQSLSAAASPFCILVHNGNAVDSIVTQQHPLDDDVCISFLAIHFTPMTRTGCRSPLGHWRRKVCGSMLAK